MKTLNAWMDENFTEDEKSEIANDAARELRAIERAREISSQFINEIMTERHIGFNEFARQAKVSPSHLSAILKGKSSPSVATLAKIAAAFGKKIELTHD